jgi:hypothetical protein
MREGDSRSIAAPFMRIVPALGRTSPEIARSIVVLPAPFAPSSVTTSPALTSRLTPRNAVIAP